MEKLWEQLFWAYFLGRPYHLSGIKTHLDTTLHIFKQPCTLPPVLILIMISQLSMLIGCQIEYTEYIKNRTSFFLEITKNIFRFNFLVKLISKEVIFIQSFQCVLNKTQYLNLQYSSFIVSITSNVGYLLMFYSHKVYFVFHE